MKENKIEKTLKSLKVTEQYFKNNIENNNGFQPEYDASVKINELLKTQPFDFEQINKIIQETEAREHFNGSGWRDFKNRLGYLARLVNSIKN